MADIELVEIVNPNGVKGWVPVTHPSINEFRRPPKAKAKEPHAPKPAKAKVTEPATPAATTATETPSADLVKE